MNVKTIDQRRQKAERNWEQLQNSPRPVIYVGAGSCGRAAGATEVVEAIRGHLKKKKVAARVIEVGCIGPCYLEPLVDIQMPGRPRISKQDSRNTSGPRTGRALSVRTSAWSGTRPISDPPISHDTRALSLRRQVSRLGAVPQCRGPSCISTGRCRHPCAT